MVFVGGGPAIPDEIVLLDVTARSIDVLRSSSSLDVDERLDLDPAADRVPDRRRRDGVRALLPAAEPGHRRARTASGRR